MANQNPSTPVKVPPSAANYTPATQDSDLRSQINSVLLKEGHVAKIQEHLLHSLHAHSSNWPTAIQTHAVSLLRSGEVTTFPALLRRVLEDIRHDTALGGNTNSSTKATNGTAIEVNGTKKTSNGAGDTNNGVAAGSTSLAVPQSVVEDALKVTRECLETQGSGVATMMMKEDNSGEMNLPCTAATSIDTMEVNEGTKIERGEMSESCSDSEKQSLEAAEEETPSDSEKQSLEAAEEETPSDSSELVDGLHNATLMSQQLDEGI